MLISLEYRFLLTFDWNTDILARFSNYLLFVIANIVRTTTDSFATGVLFVLTLAYTGDKSIATLVNSITLFILFLFSPIVGYLIDKKILTPFLSALMYCFTGCLMILFLFIDFRVALYLNLLSLYIFSLPSILYLNTTSSLIIENKPSSGYGLLASINTLSSIIGVTLGASLVETSSGIVVWVYLKVILSSVVGLFLIWIFLHMKNGSSSEIIQNSPSEAVKIFAVRGLILPNIILGIRNFFFLVKNRIKSILLLYSRSNNTLKLQDSKTAKVYILALSVAFFTLIRTFFLTNVAFTIFGILNKDIFLYTLVINTAAVTAFLIYPINGWIADKIGSWQFFIIGVLLTPLYFVSFIFITNDIILVLLWAIPIGTITDVSQIGLIAKFTPPNQRSAAIGLVSGASSFGNMLGSLLLSFFVYKVILSQLLYMMIL